LSYFGNLPPMPPNPPEGGLKRPFLGFFRPLGGDAAQWEGRGQKRWSFDQLGKITR